MSAQSHITIAEIMTKDVIMISGLATVREAIHTMHARHVSSLVVERRDDKDEFGMLVVSDIAKEVIAKGRSLDRVNVYEIMSKPVLSLPPDMNIKYAVRLLVNFGLSRALVVDADRMPLGICTVHDIVLRAEHENL